MYKAIVADDEDIIRKGIVSFLEEDPEICVVADAADGIAALNQARRYSPDIIFVDINMPKMDGLELIQKLNELDKDILVIVITGYSDFTYAQKALRLGVFDLFLKPVMEDPFYETLGKAKTSLADNRKQNALARQLRKSADYIVERCLNLNALGIMSDEACLKELTYLAEEPVSRWNLLFFYPGRVQEDDDTGISRLGDEEIPHYIRRSVKDALEGDALRISFISRDGYAVFIGPVQDQGVLKKIIRDLSLPVEVYQCTLTSLDDIPRLYRESLDKIAGLSSFSPAIQSSISYIRDHYRDPLLSLARLSEVCHISPGYLGRLFKQELHSTPMDYLSRYRIDKAAALLTNPDLKIYEVAEQVGFTSQHYFCHAFKKIMGQPPKEYRKELTVI